MTILLWKAIIEWKENIKDEIFKEKNKINIWKSKTDRKFIS